MAEEQLFFAVRRGGKWISKRVEDAQRDDFEGIDFGRDFMSALVPSADLDAALIAVETNLRAGEDPFEALRRATRGSDGLDLIRQLVRQAGYRVTVY